MTCWLQSSGRRQGRRGGEHGLTNFADGQGYRIQVQPRGQVGADRNPPLLLSRLPWNFKPKNRLQYAGITLEEARTLLAKYGEEQYKCLVMFSQNNQTGAVISLHVVDPLVSASPPSLVHTVLLLPTGIQLRTGLQNVSRALRQPRTCACSSR